MRALGRLAAMRATAESRMTSTAKIRRRGPAVETNGIKVPGWSVLATVPCRISAPPRGAGATATHEIGSTQIEMPTRVLSVPVGTDLRADDFIDVTAGELAGQAFRVVEATSAEQRTALRVPIIGEKRPAEWT